MSDPTDTPGRTNPSDPPVTAAGVRHVPTDERDGGCLTCAECDQDEGHTGDHDCLCRLTQNIAAGEAEIAAADELRTLDDA